MTCCIKKSKQILDFSLIVLDLMKTQDQCDGTGKKRKISRNVFIQNSWSAYLKTKKIPTNFAMSSYLQELISYCIHPPNEAQLL